MERPGFAPAFFSSGPTPFSRVPVVTRKRPTRGSGAGFTDSTSRTICRKSRPERTGCPARLSHMELRYVSDREPGITRKRAGRGFAYYDGGQLIRDRVEKQRFAALAIPPAYDDVWICRWENGHLQATGRDARARKQYRYHPDWTTARDADKFADLIDFAKDLPNLRSRVGSDMRKRTLGRDRVLATVVHLLDKSHIRIGNRAYTDDNGTVGLTTLRDEHVEISGERLQFDFIGKSSKRRRLSLRDRYVATTVRKLSDLPGQMLFQWQDEDGLHEVRSDHVNDWLRQTTGSEWTAKIFRTWAGTMICADALARSDLEGEKAVIEAVDATAAALGNTRAVARRSYIHPEIITAYEEGRWPGRRHLSRDPIGRARLSRTERAVVKLLNDAQSR